MWSLCNTQHNATTTKWLQNIQTCWIFGCIQLCHYSPQCKSSATTTCSYDLYGTWCCAKPLRSRTLMPCNWWNLQWIWHVVGFLRCLWIGFHKTSCIELNDANPTTGIQQHIHYGGKLSTEVHQFPKVCDFSAVLCCYCYFKKTHLLQFMPESGAHYSWTLCQLIACVDFSFRCTGWNWRGVCS